jgi:signal transduction histidine kinase
VKKIVDFHKGEIKLISKEDEGTIFSISLPIDQKI